MLLKLITVKNVLLVTIGILIMGLNSKILFAMVVMIWNFMSWYKQYLVITVKVVGYCCIHDTSKSGTINFIENYVLDDCR